MRIDVIILFFLLFFFIYLSRVDILVALHMHINKFERCIVQSVINKIN
jgi:hypothetical protein